MQYNIEMQHSRKKYHAIERIRLLFDRDTFCEIGSGIENKEGNIPYDGVITGSGLVNGKSAYVFSQDFTLHGGSIGLYHGKKIAHIIELAIKSRCPVIGIFDSGGARISEGIDALAGCGEMMFYNTMASGYIPQISVVLGPCAGAAAYSPAISDFVFCVNSISNMYITGKSVIESVTGEQCSAEELGGAKIHAEISGVAHVRCTNEKECFVKVRQLLDYIPSWCHEKQLINHTVVNRQECNAEVIPKDSKTPYDMRNVLAACMDKDSFFEIHKDFAASLIVGFGKMNGCNIGVVANQPQHNGGSLDCDSSDKGARFVRFCDAFNIPILTLVDTPGYLPGVEQEHKGIIRHGAKLLFAYAQATTVKLTVIVKKAHGGAYIAMGSKQLGADYVYALPDAELAVMGAEGAVKILYRKEFQKVSEEEYDDLLKKRLEDYKETHLNSKLAVAQGYVDEIIPLEALRERIIHDLYLIQNKQPLLHIDKKHDNIPL